MEVKSRFEHILDVTIRFKAHNQYRGQNQAAKALSKRISGLTIEEALLQLTTACEAYDEAAKTMKAGEFIKSKRGEFADPSDIKFEEWKTQLKKVHPKTEDTILTGIMNWIIFWYYLK